MLKLLFIIPNLDENITGASKRAENIAIELSKNHHVRIITSKKVHEYESGELIKKKQSSLLFNIYLTVFFKYDAWFSDYILWSLIPKKNLFFTLHDMKEYTKFNRRGFLKKILLRIIIYKCKYLITVSQNQKKIIKDVLRVDSKVILNSISKQWLREKSADFASLQSIYRLNKKYIIYVSNFTDHKNHINILKHVNLLNKYIIVLVGSPQDKSGLKILKEVQELPMVRIFQNINENELITLVRNCEFSIFPSLYEGFGMPILEAINQKKNVLVNRKLELDHFEKCERVKFVSFNKKIDDKDIEWAQNYHQCNPKCISNKDWSDSAREIIRLINA